MQTFLEAKYLKQFLLFEIANCQLGNDLGKVTASSVFCHLSNIMHSCQLIDRFSLEQYTTIFLPQFFLFGLKSIRACIILISYRVFSIHLFSFIFCTLVIGSGALFIHLFYIQFSNTNYVHY